MWTDVTILLWLMGEVRKIIMILCGIEVLENLLQDGLKNNTIMKGEFRIT